MKKLLTMLLVGSLSAFVFGLVVAGVIWQLAKSPQLNLPRQALVDGEMAKERGANIAAQILNEPSTSSQQAEYEAQLGNLQGLIQERTTAYQAQIQEANTQLATYRARINQAQQDLDSLTGQISQLEQQLAIRNATYQTELDQVVQQLNTRRNALLTQLTTVREALATANATLGR